MGDTGQATQEVERLIDREAIRDLYSRVPTIINGSILILSIMLFAVYRSEPPIEMAVWAAAMLSIFLHRYMLFWHFKPLRETAFQPEHWGNQYALSSLLLGIGWGIAGFLFFDAALFGRQLFLFSIIIGLSISGINNNSVWPRTFRLYVVASIGLLALRMFMEGTPEYRSMGLGLCVYIWVAIRVSDSANKTFRNTVTLNLRNMELVEQVRQEKQVSDQANAAKTRFLASASHDLRQPIHALGLYSDALKQEVKTDKARDLLASMGHSIDALQQLLGALLDISKLDAGMVKPNLSVFPVRPLLQHLSEEYAPQARAKGLNWRVEPTDALVYSDRTLLETMLRNLISNAIRYTDAGDITVSCSQREAEVKIEVADSGIGIPHEQQKEIFREFFQLANPERDRTQGLGLGLSIVARLASLLAHTVSVESEPGRGSRFSLILLAGDAAAQEAGATEPDSAATFAGQTELVGVKVLVIDDEASVRESTRAVLESWGCEVMLAASAELALAALDNSNLPQLLIADYRLRDNRTGVQAIEQIRAKAGSPIPALIITGDTHPERLREVQASGYTLLHKPVQPGQLRAWLRHVQRRAQK